MHLRLHLPLSGFVPPHVPGFVPPHLSGFVPPHVSAFVPPRFSDFVGAHVLILPNLRAGGSCFWGVWRLFARLQVCRSVPQSGLNASATHMRLHLPLSGFVLPHVSAFVPPHVSGFVPPHVSAFVGAHF